MSAKGQRLEQLRSHNAGILAIAFGTTSSRNALGTYELCRYIRGTRQRPTGAHNRRSIPTSGRFRDWFMTDGKNTFVDEGTALVVFDEDGIVIRVNRYASRLLGFEGHEIEGAHLLSLLDGHADAEAILKRIQYEGKDGSVRVKFVTKDGSALEATLSGLAVPCKSGGRMHIVCAICGPGGIGNASDGPGKSRVRSEDLADLLPEIVFEMDLNGILTFVNQKAFEITGYSYDDFRKGLRALDVIAPEDRERAMHNIVSIMAGRGNGPHEYTAVRKDGTPFPVLIHSLPILRGGKPAGLRGIIIDITDRRRSEHERQQEFIRREKLQGVLEMAGAMCHEFNQPMQVISGYAELLLRDNIESSPGYEELRRIKQASDRMIEITRKLQQITRYETREYIGGATIIDIDKSSCTGRPDKADE